VPTRKRDDELFTSAEPDSVVASVELNSSTLDLRIKSPIMPDASGRPRTGIGLG
jgi:hypothetical protein